MKYFKLILGIALILVAMMGMFISMPVGDSFASPNQILIKQFISVILVIIGVRLLFITLRKKEGKE
jgi:uncharacterized membrane protein YozB (DUF420 family)